MPVYTYHCDNCSYEFDIKQHFSDPHLILCPKCGEETLRKVFLPVGIVFKGSGFYATDNKSPSGVTSIGGNHDSKSAKEKSEANAGANGEKKTAGSSEAAAKPVAGHTETVSAGED